MCEYCNFDDPKVIEDYGENYAVLEKDGNDFYISVDLGNHTLISINYCPFCGRKLIGANFAQVEKLED